MIKLRLVGLVICPAFVAHSYGHEPTASPTPTPAVYQNATANTYTGSAPNNGLKATGNPSPTQGILPKALPASFSPAPATPLPSPKLIKVVASPSHDLLKAAPTPAPKFVKAIASVSTDPSEIVGPPAPNFVKAVALSEPKLQKLKSDAAHSPTRVNTATSPQPKLSKGIASTSAEFVRPLQNSISTSRYGEGDNFGSWRTPLGRLQVATKIGAAAPPGAVFHRRQRTGEILAANAPGRDPVISRIIWLRGTEEENKRAFQRCIYIHGTPQEAFLGRKASYGCIRMRSSDVIEVFNWVGIGTDVAVVDEPIRRAVKDFAAQAMVARIDQRRGPEPASVPSEANR